MFFDNKKKDATPSSSVTYDSKSVFSEFTSIAHNRKPTHAGLNSASNDTELKDSDIDSETNLHLGPKIYYRITPPQALKRKKVKKSQIIPTTPSKKSPMYSYLYGTMHVPISPIPELSLALNECTLTLMEDTITAKQVRECTYNFLGKSRYQSLLDVAILREAMRLGQKIDGLERTLEDNSVRLVLGKLFFFFCSNIYSKVNEGLQHDGDFIREYLTSMPLTSLETHTPTGCCCISKLFGSGRENAWLPIIKKSIQEQPTLIAVGAIHLANIIEGLEEAGCLIEQVVLPHTLSPRREIELAALKKRVEEIWARPKNPTQELKDAWNKKNAQHYCQDDNEAIIYYFKANLSEREQNEQKEIINKTLERIKKLDDIVIDLCQKTLEEKEAKLLSQAYLSTKIRITQQIVKREIKKIHLVIKPLVQAIQENTPSWINIIPLQLSSPEEKLTLDEQKARASFKVSIQKPETTPAPSCCAML